jgi:acetyltransferase-like isoleucine patch superfamily enzyme
MIKKILKKIYFKIGHYLNLIEVQEKPVKIEKKVLYKIGKVNMHNAYVDDLIPQAVTIGENFVASLNSMIIAHDASLYNHIKKHRVEKIIIGDNVFLGAGAIILPGVTVGDGAIIGAGSIVTKDIQPYTVVAGNPAKYMCTVNEYVKKCEERNVLFDTPKSFKKYYENSLSQVEIHEFQEKYLTQNK